METSRRGDIQDWLSKSFARHAISSAGLFVRSYYDRNRSLKTCHLTNLHLDYNRYEYDMTCK